MLTMLTLLFFGYYRGYTRVYTWFVRDIKKPGTRDDDFFLHRIIAVKLPQWSQPGTIQVATFPSHSKKTLVIDWSSYMRSMELLYIYANLHDWVICWANVGTYSSTMEHMGMVIYPCLDGLTKRMCCESMITNLLVLRKWRNDPIYQNNKI